MSAALAAQQEALLAALWDGPSATQALAPLLQPAWQRGLQVYRANGQVLAERALAAAYPVLQQLLGDDSFAQLAHAFWHRHPPQHGDMNRWGAELADDLQQDPQLQDDPYLADVARLEWALHSCGMAADVEADPASYARLLSEDPATLALRLAPGCAVLPSAWPTVSIVQAHRLGTDLDEAGQRLRAGYAETAVLWRAGLQPQLRAAQPGEAALLQALTQGQTLGHALDAALAQAPDFDFSTWLQDAVTRALVLGVIDVHEPQP